MKTSHHLASTIIPALRYRNAPAAIDWLCQVFGFERHQVFVQPDGSVAHAELKLGGGMVMLGSTRKEGEFSKFIKQPDEIGGFETQASYVTVENVDAVYEKAVAAHARIVIALQDREEGRGFTCQDMEGHLWSVGMYNPWAQVG